MFGSRCSSHPALCIETVSFLFAHSTLDIHAEVQSQFTRIPKRRYHHILRIPRIHTLEGARISIILTPSIMRPTSAPL